MSRLAVMVNPAAGGGRGQTIWEELRRGEPALASAVVVRADSPAAARRELETTLRSGLDRLLVLGGDGSAHLAANALFDLDLAGRVAIGLVPAGTGADLARALSLPRSPAEALRRVLGAEPRAIDALRLTTDDGRRRHVVNVFSAGVSGLVVELTQAMQRKGRTGYLRGTARALFRYRPLPCRVLADERVVHDGPVLLVAVANSPTFGDGMRVAPAAVLDDGEADLVVIGPVPGWQLPFRLPGIYLGSHVRNRYTSCRRGRRFRLEPDPSFPPFDLDGESFAAAPATIELLPGALRVLA